LDEAIDNQGKIVSARTPQKTSSYAQVPFRGLASGMVLNYESRVPEFRQIILEKLLLGDTVVAVQVSRKLRSWLPGLFRVRCFQLLNSYLLIFLP